MEERGAGFRRLYRPGTVEAGIYVAVNRRCIAVTEGESGAFHLRRLLVPVNARSYAVEPVLAWCRIRRPIRRR